MSENDLCGFVPFCDENDVCGFVPSVLSPFNVRLSLCGGGGGGNGNVQKERLFLISNNENETISKGKEICPKNRKYTSRSTTITHNKVDYEINSSGSGIFTQVLHRAIEQLEICQAKWVRVFVLRFDLHQGVYRRDNKWITRFRKNLLRRIQRQYEDIHEMGYLWVREQERAKAQHYHFVIYLDGNQIRHSSKILQIIESTWKSIHSEGHVPVIKNPFYFVDCDQGKRDAIYRISYLAKSRGKGYRDNQVKDYSTSRLIEPEGR